MTKIDISFKSLNRDPRQMTYTPLFVICCFGCCSLFLIILMTIISLIPTYLSPKELHISKTQTNPPTSTTAIPNLTTTTFTLDKSIITIDNATTTG